MREKSILGIDVGGTFIKFGIVRESKILKEFSLPTFAYENPQKIISQICLGIDQVFSQFNINEFIGIGIGIPGKVNAEKGIVTSAPNFRNWDRVNVKNYLKKYKLPVFLDNDANCAALGEYFYGRNKKIKNFVMVTLGTGVGGGLIIDGKLFRGESGGAGELGHITIDYNGPLCKCGKRGCIEAYAGNSYITQRTIHKLNEFKDSLILNLVNNNLELIEPKIINQAAKLGDNLAKFILEETGFYIGIGLASIANLLDIKTFIIGGGTSKAGKILLKAIENSIKQHGVTDIVKDIKVLPAKLKNRAGILGAASLVLNSINS